MLRMYGDLLPIKFRELRDARTRGLHHRDPDADPVRSISRKGNDLDFSYVSAEGGRFRVNVFRKDTGVGADLPRDSDRDSRRIDKLGLPPIVKKLCDYHQGMILVTGSTGTGKSTTLAAMIDLLNSTRKLNIISLEDPIEFVHRSKSSQVIQRELGTHLPSFAEGVRAAMREDPDVILVGEMRDAETISHGDDRGGNRSPRARHAAHDRRGQDHRPHHRRAAGRGTRTDEELPRRRA